MTTTAEAVKEKIEDTEKSKTSSKSPEKNNSLEEVETSKGEDTAEDKTAADKTVADGDDSSEETKSEASSKAEEPSDSPESSDPAFPEEELDVLSDLWLIAVKVQLPPDVARQMAPFAKFRKMPERGQKIMRDALEADPELRKLVVEKLEDFTPKEDVVDVFAMIHLWLERPPRWRAELDRFIGLSKERKELKEENAKLSKKLKEAEKEGQRAKSQQEKRSKTAKKAKSQSEQEQQRRIKAETQAERLEQDFAEAQATIQSLKDDLESETAEHQSLYRHYEKTRRSLQEALMKVSRLERENRRLLNPEEEEEEDERRRGFVKDEFWEEADISQEPRRAIPPPIGVSRFSRTAAEHYVKLTNILLVDAYNFIYCGWREETEHIHARLADSKHKPNLEVYRNRLVDKATALRSRLRSNSLEQVCLVFDGKYPGPQPDFPPQSGIQVVFSPPTKTADDEIVERLLKYPRTKFVTVVSDDIDLRMRTGDFGATIMTTTQLLHLFE